MVPVRSPCARPRITVEARRAPCPPRGPPRCRPRRCRARTGPDHQRCRTARCRPPGPRPLTLTRPGAHRSHPEASGAPSAGIRRRPSSQALGLLCAPVTSSNASRPSTITGHRQAPRARSLNRPASPCCLVRSPRSLSEAARIGGRPQSVGAPPLSSLGWRLGTVLLLRGLGSVSCDFALVAPIRSASQSSSPSKAFTSLVGVSLGEILGHASATLPSGPTRKADRTMPMNVRPYIDFSAHTP